MISSASVWLRNGPGSACSAAAVVEEVAAGFSWCVGLHGLVGHVAARRSPPRRSRGRSRRASARPRGRRRCRECRWWRWPALIATGFFENTESTLPRGDEHLGERAAAALAPRSTVSARSRNASPLSTTTAWLPGPVVTLSPELHRRARPSPAWPFTVAVPSRRFSPGGTVARGERLARGSRARPAAPDGGSQRSSCGVDRIRVHVVVLVKTMSHTPWPELQAPALELGLGPRWRARRECLRGIGEAGVACEDRRARAPRSPASRWRSGGSRRARGARPASARERRLEQPALVVALLGPRIGEEHVDAGERARRNHVAQHFDRIVLDDAHVA